jgi:hypothetical protein
VTYHKIVSNEFWDGFTGGPILDENIKRKLSTRHNIYEEDLADAFGDPYMVVTRNRRKSPQPHQGLDSRGIVYEILAETQARRVMFIVGRLFPNGNLYIITAYWADRELEIQYHRESEVLRDE